MLLSRFWYVFLSLLLGAAAFVLFLAQSLYNRTVDLAMKQALSSDAQVVSWYLRNDARERSAQLLHFTADSALAKGLELSSADQAKVPPKAREAVQQALQKIVAEIPKEQSFDAVFAVDQHGRVVAHLGYEQATGVEDFELGGYPVVADALHGFVRDDSLVLDRLYRVVSRPVEAQVGQQPAGAILGARIIDDRFARELSDRTGAAVAFYANGQRVSSGAPEGFDRSQMDQIVRDLRDLDADEGYQNKGRSDFRVLAKSLGVVYSRMPGEAWHLGAGYVVARFSGALSQPFEFFTKADDADKKSVNVVAVGVITFLGLFLGIVFSLIEHSRPLRAFHKEAQRFGKGETDQLLPSKFVGLYRRIASDLNDGIDAAVGKAGGTRRAADLGEVLGDLPAEPQMSAFAIPGDGADTRPLPSAPGLAPPSSPRLPLPSAPRALPKPPSAAQNPLPAPPARPGAPPRPAAAAAAAPPAEADSESDDASDEAAWRQVFEDFVALKQECGEPTEGLTYEKFEKTLIKNRDALISKHGASAVRFSVYVRDGKAALKASPVRA